MINYLLGLLTIPALSIAIFGGILAYQTYKRHQFNKALKEMNINA